MNTLRKDDCIDCALGMCEEHGAALVQAEVDYDWLASKPRDIGAIVDRFGSDKAREVIKDMQRRIKWDDGWRLFYFYPPHLSETLTDARTGKMWRQFYASSYEVDDNGQRIDE
jgi:hypothetical protein